MSSIAIVGDVVEHVVIKDEERTSEGDGPAFNKAAIRLLAAFNEAVGEQDVRRAVDYHLVLVAATPEEPVRVLDRSERAKRPTERLTRMPEAERTLPDAPASDTLPPDDPKPSKEG